MLFPNASQRRFWLVEVAESDREAATTPNPTGVYLNPAAPSVDENHDIALVLGLIERMKSQYNIDAGRIYMQGMSMGNVMTSQFARYFGQVLAGAAGSGGPTRPELLFDRDGAPINRGGPLAIWQTRLELDAVPPHYGASVREVVRANRDYWLRVNGVSEAPEIAVVGEDNLAFYRGERADVVFRDVRNRDHGQTFDDAELVWSYLFSGVRRGADGGIERLTPGLARRGDRNAVAVCEGRRYAWVDNARVPLESAPFRWQKLKYHGLDGRAEVRGEYLYVPLTFIADAFGATLVHDVDGAAATLVLTDGRVLQFARGSVGCILDGRVTSMLAEAVLRDGALHISMEWICEHVLGLRASHAEGVLYVTDHHALLSRNMAYLLEDLLSD